MLTYFGIFLGLMIVSAILIGIAIFNPGCVKWVLNRMPRNLCIFLIGIHVFLRAAYSNVIGTFTRVTGWLQQRIYGTLEVLWARIQIIINLSFLSYSARVILGNYAGYAMTAGYIISFFLSVYWSFHDLEMTRFYMVCGFFSGILVLPTIRVREHHQSYFYWIVGDFNNLLYIPLIFLFDRRIDIWNAGAAMFVFQSFNAVLERTMYVMDRYRRQPALLFVNGETHRMRLQIINEPLYRTVYRLFTTHAANVIALINRGQKYFYKRRWFFRNRITVRNQQANREQASVWNIRYLGLYFITNMYGFLYCVCIYQSLFRDHETLLQYIQFFFGSGIVFLFIFRHVTEIPTFGYWLLQEINIYLCVPGMFFYFFPNLWNTAAVMFLLRTYNAFIESCLIAIDTSRYLFEVVVEEEDAQQHNV